MSIRGPFVFLLVFFLIACQSVSVTTPLASLTELVSETPPPATATSIASQAAVLTPTVPPAELKRRAGPICENAFSALVETGSLMPPFAVLKKAAYADAPSWEFAHQIPHLGSLAASEVKTIFCISETRTQTGTYTDGSAAYQLFWEVRAVSWPGGKVIEKNSFGGPPPPKTNVFSSGAAEGLFPYQEFAAWIFNRVDHPDFLYFSDAITSLAISPEGHLGAFGTAIANDIVDSNYQAKIFLFDPSDLQTDAGTSSYLDVLAGHQGMVTSLAFSPDGKLLASSGYDLFIKFWNVQTGGLLGQVRLADTPTSLSFSPAASKLAVASNLEVTLIDSASMQIEKSFPVSSVDNLAFSPDGRLLYASTPFQIAVIDASAGTVILEFPDSTALAPTLTVADDGSVLSVTYETPDTVDNFALSPDGRRLFTYTVDQSVEHASGTENVRLATWEAETGKYVRETRFIGDYIGAIRLSPDGNLLALGNNDEIWVWDTANWQVRRKLSGHIDLIEGLAFTPDGTNILSAGRDGTIRVWSLEG